MIWWLSCSANSNAMKDPVGKRSLDHFGGPTLVEPPLFDEDCNSDVTTPWKREDAENVVRLVKPPTVAALAAANPRSIQVRLVPNEARSPDRGVNEVHDLVASPAAAASTAVAHAPAQAPDAALWAEYRELGLGAPKLSKQAAKLAVSGYRALGFGILTLIVAVLVGYIASTTFYFLSHTWITPTVVSVSDEKVVQLKTELAALQNQREKTAADLHDSERVIAMEQLFQIEFIKAMKEDLQGRRAALDKVRLLAGAASATRRKIRATNDEYARQFVDRTSAEYAAGLIDRNAKLTGDYQIEQISSANLSLAERQSEFERQAQELDAQTRSLDAVVAAHADVALSYDVLKIKRDFDASKLALAKALETRDTLAAGLVRQDEILKGVKQAAYLRALDDHATVALVPYDNLGNASAGTTLYACRLGMVVCRSVGSVLEVLPGEIQFKHPHNDTVLRGQMVELRLDDTGAAKDEVLFVGGKPMWF
jgi:hypothetical protein